MKDKLVIIPCGKKKIWDDGNTKGPVRAEYVYTGTMFNLGKWYAEVLPADLIILSAKYGYLWPWDEIEPYDVTFSKKSSKPICSKELSEQIRKLVLDEYKEIIVLGGKEYRDVVIDSFDCLGRSDIKTPYTGLSIGRYQKILKRDIKDLIVDEVKYEFGIYGNETFEADKFGKIISQIEGQDHCEVATDGSITFSCWKNYWSIPRGGGGSGFEGPSYIKDSNLDSELSEYRVNQKRKHLLSTGPKVGAWEQFKLVSALVGKRVKLDYFYSWCGDAYKSIETDIVGMHLNRNEEGFLQCYICLKNIVQLDVDVEFFWDRMDELIPLADDIMMVSISEIENLTIIPD